MDGLLHAFLTCVTAGPGLGFNRAVLFLADEEGATLSAAMAIGPATAEEAQATWAELARQHKSLGDLVQTRAERTVCGFQHLVEGLRIPIEPRGATRNPLLEAYHGVRTVTIADPAALGDIPADVRRVFGGTEVVCVPLPARGGAIGLVVADNAFTHDPIGPDRVRLLELLAFLGGLALETARVQQRVERQAQQLAETVDQLRAAQEQLIHKERLATVGAVVARVSHEIRNPLATIGGFARFVRTHPDDRARVERNATIIVDEVVKLEGLLKEMLDFTTPRPPALAPTDLNALVRRLVEVHRDQLESRHITLEVDLAAALPPVMADREQLLRVFLNLWQNAAQALDGLPPERPRRLRVQTGAADGQVGVTFADSGPGIPDDVRPQIFTPFFTTKRHGSGLGLAVVKKIVDDHGGRLDVRSDAGGATMKVLMPEARV